MFSSRIRTALLISELCVAFLPRLAGANRPPTFLNSFFGGFIPVSEDTLVGTSIAQLSATDPDEEPLAYAITGEDGNFFFRVNSYTGVVTVKHALDRETKEEIFVIFTVTDLQSTIPASVKIQVTDVNDNAPSFQGLPYLQQLPEDTAVGTTVFTVRATDPDQGMGGSVLFFFQPSSDLFRLDSARGFITLVRSLDYETAEVHQLRINATDQDQRRPLSTITNLLVTVLDVQDTDPYFLGLPYSTSVTENVPLGTSVQTLQAKDGDRGNPRNVSYSIVSGNTNDIFYLDALSGLLSVNGALDRENVAFTAGFTLRVRATEMLGNGALSNALVETAFGVTILDENDNAPTFNRSEYALTVSELAQVGFAMPLFIQVVDKDQGVNSDFTLQLAGQNAADFLVSPGAVRGRTDVTLRLVNPLDYETYPEYNLTLFANETSGKHWGSARVRIVLINENDNRPIFSLPLYNVSVWENATLGTSVVQVLATDLDAGVFGQVSYHFSDDSDKFSLDPASGLISVAAALDFEATPRFTVTVMARDGGGQETAGRVRINLLDVNDNTPVFQRDSYVGTAHENDNSLTPVVRVRATDEDSPPNNQITYSILSTSAYSSYFSITVSGGYGVVTLARALDYEKIPGGTISLTIMALDGGSPPLNSTVTAIVEVFDENDNSPIFDRNSYSIAIPENILAGATVLYVNATDGDQSPEYGQLSLIYSLEGSTQFRINARSGDVTSTTLLDREAVSQYILIVRAVDGGDGNDQKTGIATVNITLLDVNDNDPAWRDLPYAVTIVENTPGGTDIFTVSAADPDLNENGTLVYAIDPPNPFYRINTASGKIRTTGLQLDREDLNPISYASMRSIVVSGTDRGSPPRHATASATVTVLLQDVNDNEPSFVGLPYALQVLEGLPANSTLFQVTATDPDEGANGNVTYSMTAALPRPDFQLDAATGLITTLVQLDREVVAAYQLRLVATDRGTPALSSTTTLSLVVLDVNDNAPTFHPTRSAVSLLESVARDSVVISLNCTDADSGLNAELSFFITGGNQDGQFSVGFRDGLVRTVVSLDRETKASYSLVIEAIDNGPAGSRRTGTTTLDVLVLDVNDNRPLFLEGSYEVSVPENVTRGAIILQVQANDIDEGINGRVWYRIISGNQDGIFLVNVSSGLISRGATPLDRETVALHVLQVEAFNNDSVGLSSIIRVTVVVEDVNDEAPTFAQQQYVRTGLRETAGVGTSVIVVKAMDRDLGDAGTVRYSIASGGNDTFGIDESTGLIVTVAPIDYETRPEYLLMVVATDQAPPFHTASCELRVSLQNELDEKLSFSRAAYQAALSEAAVPGTVVVRVAARSADALAMISYRLDPDTDAKAAALFRLNNLTGEITTQVALDREATDSYVLTVLSRDGGPREAIAVVYVNVTDENDNSPEFEAGSATLVEVRESAAPGTLLAVLYATDRDAGSNGTVNYTIADGNTGWAFSISRTLTGSGEVRVAQPLDRETVEGYWLRIMALDGGSPPRSTTFNLSVIVLDVNDNVPTFLSPGGYAVSVVENVGGGTTVVRVCASDRDAGPNAALSYYITAGDASQTFRIDRASGEISTRPEPPDRERRATYNLTITVEDDGNPALSATTSVLIRITDENDNAPAFEAATYEVLLTEGPGTAGTTVANVAASDPDEGDNSRVVYAIVSGNTAATFGINNSTGVLTAVKALDFEVSAGLYLLVVTATDQPRDPARRLTSTATVSVHVADVNDVTPWFPRSYEGPIDVSEGQPGPRIATFMASDQDSGLNGEVEYSIIEGDPRNEFVISPADGDLRVRRYVELDRETQAFYNLTIMAKDMGTPPLNSSLTVGVRVLDVNDNDPVFLNLPANASLSEAAAVLAIVSRVRASDADEGRNALLSYSITDGNTGGAFAINDTTGLVYVNRPLDRERLAEYRLTLTVRDNPDNPSYARKDSDIMIVTILDENDNSPVFSQVTYEAEIPENSPNGTVLTVLNGPIYASDADFGVNATLAYSLLGGSSAYFLIDRDRGNMSMAFGQGLDREGIPGGRLELTILVQDGGRRNATVRLGVTVLDVNDNTPTFNVTSQTAHVLENSPAGTLVASVWATDADAGPNGQVTFRIESGGGDKLSIGPSDGIIHVAPGANIDRETRAAYTLMVVAVDRGNPPLSGSAIVRVLVDDVNDERPAFLAPVQTVSVLESLSVGSFVATVTALDLDLNPQLEYFIIEVLAYDDANAIVPNQSNVFAIDFTTGDVRLNSALDREKVASYVLTVSVRDKASGSINVSVSNPNAVLTVSVVDVNDNAPWFRPRGVAAFSDAVIEGALPGTTLLSVSAVDPDKGPNGEVSYQLLDLPAGQYVRLDDPVSGKITINRTIDYEQVKWLNFTVRAQDRGTPPRNTDAPVSIRIIDINDNNPIFNPASYSKSVFEDVAPGTVLMRITATDADSGNFAVVVYSLVDGEGKFGITPSTGELYVLSPLDREKKDQYTLTVTARDNPGDLRSNQRENSAQAYVTVIDVNDVRPVFSLPGYQTAVYENEPAGTSVLTLTATDLDEGDNGRVDYSLQGPGSDAFTVHATSGLVTSMRLLKSYERFNLTAVATDHGRPPLWGQAGLYVEVLDVNDHRPVFVLPPNGTVVNITEEREAGFFVYEVLAVDGDEGQNGAVRYSFLHAGGVGSRDWESFRINATSGIISTARALDRESQAVYSLILLASDQGQPVSYESTQPLQVVLDDIDDNEPVFIVPLDGGAPYQSFSIPEHSPPGTAVGNVSGAVDADVGANAVVYYFIAAGNEGNKFNLSRWGLLVVLSDLDREVSPYYAVIVKASSNPNWNPAVAARARQALASPFQAQAAQAAQAVTTGPEFDPSKDRTLREVRVYLEDINDQWPVFTNHEYTAGVAVDAKVGSELLQLEAVDRDVGNNSIVLYRILSILYIKHSSNSSTRMYNIFTLGGRDGILRTYDLFTAYGPGYFMLEVVVADLAGHNDTATVGVYILRDDQRVKIVINETPERVRAFQEQFVKLLSNITGAIVNTDDVQYHVDSNGRVNFAQSDVLIHVVNKDTNQIMDVSRVIALIDDNKEQLKNLFRNYNVLDVQPAVVATKSDDLTSLQMAVVILAILLVLVIAILVVMNWYYRTTHKRKLRAIVAGSLGNQQGFMDILDNMPNTNKFAVEGANPVWLDPYYRDMELAAQAEHDDGLPDNLSDITELWNSPAKTHGTFGRDPLTGGTKSEDDRYLRAAIQEYDNIARLGQIMRDGPVKGSLLKVVLDDYLRLKKLFAARVLHKSLSIAESSSTTELIPAGSDDADEAAGSSDQQRDGLADPEQVVASLRLRHHPPVELPGGGEGVRALQGSTGTLLTSDPGSLHEDERRAGAGRAAGHDRSRSGSASGPGLAGAVADGLARSSETVRTDEGYGESAKSTPAHRYRPCDGRGAHAAKGAHTAKGVGGLENSTTCTIPINKSIIAAGQEILEVTEL
ncbi:cadherin-23 [Lampetra fluviatilis]